LIIATGDKVIVYDYINSVTIAEYGFTTSQYSYPRFNVHTMNYIVQKDGTSLISININTGAQLSSGVYNAHNCTLEGEYLFGTSSSSAFGVKPF
jgi:hypothetical protein